MAFSSSDTFNMPYFTLQPPSALLDLPAEVCQRILEYLDIDDLLLVSRTCKQLRQVATDPILHSRRLKEVPSTLASALSKRPARSDLLRQRRPLISLTPHLPALHLNSPTTAAQISAYLSLSRLMVTHRLRRAIENRVPIAILGQTGVLDPDLLKHSNGGAGEIVTQHKVAFSLAPVVRQLKKAQKADKLRQSMRASDDANGWKTPVKVFERVKGVWKENDPRVVSVLCPSIKRNIRFWESLKFA